MKNTKRILLAAVAALLLVAVSVGGTLAWLVDTTGEVTNTFTAAGIDIELTETKAPDGSVLAENQTWSAQLIPGKAYFKNPTVTVMDSTDVEVYLFVKFEEIAPTDETTKDYLTYTSTLTDANGWTKGDGTNIPANVWYRTVSPSDPVKSWVLLADILDTDNAVIGQVKVNNLTKAKTNITENSLQLKYTAYAIQTEGFTPATAWAQVSAPVTP